MDEKTTAGISDPAIAAIPQGATFNGAKASENEVAALKLRLMMKNADGEDKCALCKAAEALEKAELKAKSDMSWVFPFLFLMFLSPWGGGMSGIDPGVIKAYLEATSKGKESEAAEKTPEV